MQPTEYDRLFELEDELWWFRGMERISTRLIESFFEAAPDRKTSILDAGCGTGGMLGRLADYGEPVGIDASERALTLAARRGTTPLVRGSVEALGFRDASFDLVTSFDVVYHLEVESDVRALSELKRILRPGGMLLLRVPAYEFLRSQHDVAVHTRQRYSKSELENKLVAAGLSTTYLTYANTFLFPLALMKRLSEKLFPPKSETSEVQPLGHSANGVFRSILGLEARLMPRLRFPFGLSIFAVATKPRDYAR